MGEEEQLGRRVIRLSPGSVGEANRTGADDSLLAAFDDLTDIRELGRADNEEPVEHVAVATSWQHLVTSRDSRY